MCSASIWSREIKLNIRVNVRRRKQCLSKSSSIDSRFISANRHLFSENESIWKLVASNINIIRRHVFFSSFFPFFHGWTSMLHQRRNADSRQTPARFCKLTWADIIWLGLKLQIDMSSSRDIAFALVTNRNIMPVPTSPPHLWQRGVTQVLLTLN